MNCVGPMLPMQGTHAPTPCVIIHGRLPLPGADFNLDFYTEVQDLSYLAKAMGSRPFSKRFK